MIRKLLLSLGALGLVAVGFLGMVAWLSRGSQGVVTTLLNHAPIASACADATLRGLYATERLQPGLGRMYVHAGRAPGDSFWGQVEYGGDELVVESESMSQLAPALAQSLEREQRRILRTIWRNCARTTAAPEFSCSGAGAPGARPTCVLASAAE